MYIVIYSILYTPIHLMIHLTYYPSLSKSRLEFSVNPPCQSSSTHSSWSLPEKPSLYHPRTRYATLTPPRLYLLLLRRFAHRSNRGPVQSDLSKERTFFSTTHRFRTGRECAGLYSQGYLDIPINGDMRRRLTRRSRMSPTLTLRCSQPPTNQPPDFSSRPAMSQLR